MTRSLLLALPLLLTACPNNDGNGDDDDTGFAGLGDPLDWVVGDEQCELYVTNDGLECPDIEGGTRYLVADLAFLDDGDDDPTTGELEGIFYWAVYANGPWAESSDWQASRAFEEGKDYCVVTLGISGTWEEGGGGACPTCEYTLTYNTTYAPGSSTCPAALNQAEGPALDGIEGAYWGIEIEADGSATAVDTSRAWAVQGAADEGGVILISDGACAWFGASECS